MNPPCQAKRQFRYILFCKHKATKNIFLNHSCCEKWFRMDEQQLFQYRHICNAFALVLNSIFSESWFQHLLQTKKVFFFFRWWQTVTHTNLDCFALRNYFNKPLICFSKTNESAMKAKQAIRTSSEASWQTSRKKCGIWRLGSFMRRLLVFFWLLLLPRLCVTSTRFVVVVVFRDRTGLDSGLDASDWKKANFQNFLLFLKCDGRHGWQSGLDAEIFRSDIQTKELFEIRLYFFFFAFPKWAAQIYPGIAGGDGFGRRAFFCHWFRRGAFLVSQGRLERKGKAKCQLSETGFFFVFEKERKN